MMARRERHGDGYDEVYISIDEPVFTTGVVCRLLDIPVWVLKQLDSEDIVSPPRESEGQARLYSKKELKMIKHCWYYMKTHKVKVHGLKVILQMEEGIFESE
jgi:DNA-binding transcriptional MerR regulator